jgi:hypothetical protein
LTEGAIDETSRASSLVREEPPGIRLPRPFGFGDPTCRRISVDWKFLVVILYTKSEIVDSEIVEKVEGCMVWMSWYGASLLGWRERGSKRNGIEITDI